MSMLPTLYGFDSKKKIKKWSIKVSGDEMIVSHGLLDGKVQTKTTKVKGKNIGRANETTPGEQAIKESTAKWQKQKDKSYCEDINNIVQLKNPMLAQTYKKWDGPYYCQPKLDGVRGLVQFKCDQTREVEIKSRGGKNYPVPEHLGATLELALMLNNGNPLDGELYIHGEPLNRIVGAVKKPNDLSPRIQFRIFDVAIDGQPYHRRDKHMEVLSHDIRSEDVVFVPSHLIVDESDLIDYHDGYVEAGYEGIILRKPEGLYKFDHRSPDLLKLKHFKDAEWTIRDVIPDKDGFGIIVCDCPESTDPNPDNDYFNVTLGSMEERKWQLSHKDVIIGKEITVKYQAKTKYNKPQFGTGVAIRDYE